MLLLTMIEPITPSMGCHGVVPVDTSLGTESRDLTADLGGWDA